MKFKFGAILFITFICAPATLVVGQLVEDKFYIPGQSLILIGVLGLGGAFASLGIFALANAESFTKGTIIPLFSGLPPKIGGTIIGVQFIILTVFMLYQAIVTVGNIVAP